MVEKRYSKNKFKKSLKKEPTQNNELIINLYNKKYFIFITLFFIIITFKKSFSKRSKEIIILFRNYINNKMKWDSKNIK